MSKNLTSQLDSSDKPLMTRQQRWRAENSDAYRSHLIVQAARRKGILTKPDRCQCCGKEGPLDAHHPDHQLALNVRFCCRACHAQHHARRRKATSKQQAAIAPIRKGS